MLSGPGRLSAICSETRMAGKESLYYRASSDVSEITLFCPRKNRRQEGLTKAFIVHTAKGTPIPKIQAKIGGTAAATAT